MQAVSEFKAAIADLENFCEKETNFKVHILTDCYPMQVHFTPAETQQSLFDADTAELTDNVDENGEITSIIITLGISPQVRSNLKFKMEAALLKKLIKKASKIGELYLHAFREFTQQAFAGAVNTIMEQGLDEMWKHCGGSSRAFIYKESEFKAATEAAQLNLMRCGIRP